MYWVRDIETGICTGADTPERAAGPFFSVARDKDGREFHVAHPLWVMTPVGQWVVLDTLGTDHPAERAFRTDVVMLMSRRAQGQ